MQVQYPRCREVKTRIVCGIENIFVKNRIVLMGTGFEGPCVPNGDGRNNVRLS